jgi:hypothetical protein
MRMRRASVVALAAVVAWPVAGVATASTGATTGALTVAVPVIDQSCASNTDMAHLVEKVHAGHGVAGTWTLRPVFTCAEAESGLSVHAVLARNGKALLTSAGTCTSSLVPACTTVAGPARTATLGTSIRATYVIHLTVSLTGADAALVKCPYDATTLTATCTADSDPIVVR